MAQYRGYIYGLHAGDDVIKYVGQTIQKPTRRFVQHRSSSKTSQYDVYKWVREHGIDNIVMVILAEASSKAELDELEIMIIAQYGLENLRNTSIGGGMGMTGREHTEETKAKISAKVSGANSGMYGKHHTEEAKAKISAAHKGHTVPEERRLKISESLTGRTHNEETKLKMSETHLKSSHRRGVQESEETRRKKSEALKGKPSQAMHTRWHVKRGIINPDCTLCVYGIIESTTESSTL